MNGKYGHKRGLPINSYVIFDVILANACTHALHFCTFASRVEGFFTVIIMIIITYSPSYHKATNPAVRIKPPFIKYYYYYPTNDTLSLNVKPD